LGFGEGKSKRRKKKSTRERRSRVIMNPAGALIFFSMHLGEPEEVAGAVPGWGVHSLNRRTRRKGCSDQEREKGAKCAKPLPPR